MTSIKHKLFFVLLSSMVVFVISSILLNTLFLENYYTYRNKNIFIAKHHEIAEETAKSDGDINSLLQAIDREDGIHSLIINRRLNIEHDSFPQTTTPGLKVHIDLADFIRSIHEQLDNNSFVYGIYQFQTYNTKELTYITHLDEDKILILQPPMKGIYDSSQMANEFFGIVGLIILIAGSVLVYLFSKRLTAPVVELNKMAGEISNLNFEGEFHVKSKDEIGLLGKSMNEISRKLNATIQELSRANQMMVEDLENKERIDEMRREFTKRFA